MGTGGTGFSKAQEKFTAMLEKCKTFSTSWLNAIESEIGIDGRELICKILQGYIDSRGTGDVGQFIKTHDHKVLTHRRIHKRIVQTLYGKIEIHRMGYSLRTHPNVFPLDALLNLPLSSSFSFGLQRFIASRIPISAFSDVLKLTNDITGVAIGQRQALEIAQNAAVDFDAYYAKKSTQTKGAASILVLTTDGKGIVMRHDALTEATQKKALSASKKMNSRLSRGEKSNRKRMAQVASVYFIEKFTRTPEDILNDLRREKVDARRPRPVQKRVWASVEKNSIDVINAMFDEAIQRDPKHKKKWVVLVDGNKHQLSLVKSLAKKNNIQVTIILDIIHVIEYLWDAARALLNEENHAACEEWVDTQLKEIMDGNAGKVAGSIRMSSSKRKLKNAKKKTAEICATYIAGHKAHMNYAKYLKQGYPIATGVIEGACRYLIKDRMDITGARWSLSGAESILKLRSLVTSRDFDDYWDFHLKSEYDRNYAEKIVNLNKFKSLQPSL